MEEFERSRMLVAVAPPSQAKLHALLSGSDADFFDDYRDALSALARGRYASVVVGVHFGESRMFDFVREVKKLQPGARLVCVQGITGHLGPPPPYMAPALQALGVEGVLDLTPLSESSCRMI